MCKMCDDPSLTMADVRADMFRTIEKYGWLVQYVEAEPGYASFAYTVGLTGKDAPELYVTGLDPQAAATLLNDAGRTILQGDLGPCDLYTAPDGRQYLLGRRPGPAGGYRGVRTELRGAESDAHVRVTGTDAA